MNSFKLYTDGASRGNPGPSGVGIVIKEPNGNIIKKTSFSIGNCTNNVSEYTALITGLSEAIGLGIKKIEVFLDSELLIKQIKGFYRARSTNISAYLFLAKYLSKNFDQIEYFHIPREENKDADRLATKATIQ